MWIRIRSGAERRAKKKPDGQRIKTGNIMRRMMEGTASKASGKPKGKWYLFDKNGYMLTGWQKVKDIWYYLNENGSMATGFVTVDGKSTI